MRKSLFFLSLAILLLLAACGPAGMPPPPTSAPAAVEATEAPIILPSTLQTPTPVPYLFGMLLAGPSDDGGWNQAHYQAGLYIEAKLGVKMIHLDKVNPVDNPAMSPAQAAGNLAGQGAKLVIFTAAGMQPESVTFAQTHPEIYVISVGSDTAWADGRNYIEIPNFANLMGRMEYGQMLAGCAAALSTQSGQVGYIGPLLGDESRRLAASAYLGTKYCWSNYRGQDPAALRFTTAWAETAAPGEAANAFYADGFDVVISGIDSAPIFEAARQNQAAGRNVWASAYNSIPACEQNADVCLGTPYFNWGPGYVALVKTALDGNWQSIFRWNGPDWADINESETSAIGFLNGAALSQDSALTVEQFTLELANGLNLWAGPLNLQDGSLYLAAGEVAGDPQIWYLPQLLEGMESR